MFKIIVFFIITLLAMLYARVDILLTCAKHSHDLIFSLTWEILAHKTSLAPPSFIEVPVPSQESEWSCICVLGVLILSLPTIFLLTFGTVSTVWYLFVFLLTFGTVSTVWYLFVFSFYYCLLLYFLYFVIYCIVLFNWYSTLSFYFWSKKLNII